MKLEAILVKRGCRHVSKGVCLVENTGLVLSDNHIVNLGVCKKCTFIVMSIGDCAKYYTLKINEVERK